MRTRTVTKPIRAKRGREKYLNATAVGKYRRARRVKARMARASRQRNRA